MLNSLNTKKYFIMDPNSIFTFIVVLPLNMFSYILLKNLPKTKSNSDTLSKLTILQHFIKIINHVTASTKTLATAFCFIWLLSDETYTYDTHMWWEIHMWFQVGQLPKYDLIMSFICMAASNDIVTVSIDAAMHMKPIILIISTLISYDEILKIQKVSLYLFSSHFILFVVIFI